ncbi:MAG: hypothetical protein CSA26_05155 [Desulfobacterales bacterium]|nr:MAG: hypothetical protein CSA26_05155 [Desulfobacterales bacterium]
MCKWSDFTEKSYKTLLLLAKEKYSFKNYTDNFKERNIVLWRHDIDFSIHRALRLAQIESDCDVKSTFFIQLSSCFYNVFEHTICDKVRQIIKLGHHVGLHFDPSLYVDLDREAMMRKMAWEKTVLEELLDKEVTAVSFHNPDFGDWLSVDQFILCGMVNAYSNFLKMHFHYCSDSNGYWRFDSIKSVLRSKKYSRLQVLTHPGWWVSEPIPPRQRVRRCVDGRARKNMIDYDEVLRVMKRENIDD